MARRNLLSDYLRFRVGPMPSDRSELPIVPKKDEVVERLDSSEVHSVNQLTQFRTLAEDRQTMYNSYDEMKSDSVIAAALELYADDATAYDEKGRIIWVESDQEEIARAGNRLLDVCEIPERSWKHIYQACLYGDYYLKLYREGDLDEDESEDKLLQHSKAGVTIVNDKKKLDRTHVGIPNYIEYVEDVVDPACMFDLRKRGKTAGFIEVSKEAYSSAMTMTSLAGFAFQLKDIEVYRPDRFVHIMVGDNLSRTPEEVTIDMGETSTTYTSARGKSILQDVYPIQKELQLLEDTLLLNRLTRSSLIRLLEIELGDMPKKEVNDYLRRIKSLIEQHISMDKGDGSYHSFNAPGPIDNVIYIPVRNGKGSISVNNLGGDVNVRDIADVDYFNNKRAGALKIPRAYLGDDMDGSGLSNGGSLTRLSSRYARTIKRIQTAYIRAITTMLNLFFIDKKLDYVNKFTVRMTSPSTTEDLERNELIAGNVDLISSIMDLTESLEGSTQKKILTHLIATTLNMPEIATMIEEDDTPEEDIDIDGSGMGVMPSVAFDREGSTVDLSTAFENPESSAAEAAAEPSSFESSSGEEGGSSGGSGGFSDADFAEFEDTF